MRNLKSANDLYFKINGKPDVFDFYLENGKLNSDGLQRLEIFINQLKNELTILETVQKFNVFPSEEFSNAELPSDMLERMASFNPKLAEEFKQFCNNHNL
jgi:hypothetical protein